MPEPWEVKEFVGGDVRVEVIFSPLNLKWFYVVYFKGRETLTNRFGNIGYESWEEGKKAAVGAIADYIVNLNSDLENLLYAH